jgi:hypothetical protein
VVVATEQDQLPTSVGAGFSACWLLVLMNDRKEMEPPRKQKDGYLIPLFLD